MTDASSERPYDIFISYSRADTAKATRLHELLVAHGHHVFFDSEGIDIGAEFPDVIDRAVKGAKVVLGCWTQEAIRRRWVRIENRIALDRGTLIAIGLEPMNPEELPAEFYNVNVLDMSDFDGDAAHPGWQRVLAAIDRRLNRTPGARADEVRPAAAAPPPLARCKRLSPVLLGAAALVAAGTDIGGWYVFGGPATLDRAAFVADLDTTLNATRPVMDNAVTRALNDGETSTNGKIYWAEAQLVAVTRFLSPSSRGRYEAAVKRFYDPACWCVKIEGAPFTVVSLWTVMAYATDGRVPPAPILDALLAAQNREGWWSSTMDAADRPDNGATYITAFGVIALRELDAALAGDPATRAKVKAARERAVEWLKRRRPKRGDNWPDYPDNSLRSDAPVISAVATLALLPEVPSAEAKTIAGDYVAALDKLTPVAANFSNDVNVTRADGETFVDNYRHVPRGWEIHALARSYLLLDGDLAAKAAGLLAEAEQTQLSDPQLARQDWMLAEQYMGLRGARDAFAKPPAPRK
ncbi:hypothetical protein CVO77_15695 [Sphingopyxis lindanitolerans]|uniref:TIR domain-containing protein n=1 Tax=Sphingopyxis lindanitolerans TaxID=2054227 RepID=A0A2S8B236_9SPHN|nr:toll/interleukin-1 receptor domain-containing protein [Sphingopyxis lindanitolerans]PQM26471.1 hypothetical protein CVO77_15695 [Sphingopyxis lindanitolerans]